MLIIKLITAGLVILAIYVVLFYKDNLHKKDQFNKLFKEIKWKQSKAVFGVGGILTQTKPLNATITTWIL